MERYRDRRSPDRGSLYSRGGAGVDSYTPGGARGGRPRSRSPPSNYRRRSRTPPPRADTWTPRYRDQPDSYAPSRRESGRDDRYGGRPRSPPGGVKRGRDFSPPPAKRERLASPDRGYGRPRSPPRRGYSPPRERNSYRPRSRTPPRRNDDQYAAPAFRRRSPSPRSGRNSGVTSRRSSPPRQGRGQGESYNTPDARVPLPTRSPPRRQDYDDRRQPSPPPNDYETPPNGDYRERESLPPLQTDYRDRGPPAGPSSARRPDRSPMSANPNATPVSLSAHNRPGMSPVVPPSGPANYSTPRGGYGSGSSFRGRGMSPRDAPRGRGWGGPPPGRGRPDYRDDYRRGPPAPRYDRHTDRSSTAFGGGNSTSRTVPQSVRFDVNGALSDLPKIKDHGERLPPLYDGSKAEKLEEEAARLRRMIDDKDGKKRQLSREWDAIDRERQEAELRGNLAEERLGELVGEGGGVAF